MKTVKIVLVVTGLFASSAFAAAPTSYALVRASDGKVETFVRGDLPAGYAPPAGYTLVAPADLPAGWQRIEAAAPVVPEIVTRRQLKEELIACDLIDQVEAALAAIPDAKARRIALNWWTESQDFRRDHPLIAQIGLVLGLTSAQIDAHWIAAAAR